MEQKRIYDILKGLVACDSISCTDKELKAEKYVYDFLQSLQVHWPLRGARRGGLFAKAGTCADGRCEP